jgi:PAS domain S-box-containing protein
MTREKLQNSSAEIEAPLRRWRAQALNWILVVVSVVALPAAGLVVIDLTRAPRDWSGWLLVVCYLALVAATVLRRLDPRLRASALLLVVYAIGLVDYARYGLLGDGRQYLLVLPVIAVLLVSLRSGFLAAGLSLLTLGFFVVLSQTGALAQAVASAEAQLSLGTWIGESINTTVLIIPTFALLVFFYRFQLKTLAEEHRTATDLAEAQARLQEQNQDLEQRVDQRTEALTRTVAQLQEEKAEGERMAMALSKSEQLYRSVVDNSIDVYFRLDGDGNVLLVSPSGATLLGYPSVADMQGLNITRDFYADPKDHGRFWSAVKKDGSVKDFETTLKRRDGTEVVVMANARVYLDEEGVPVGIEGFLRDFSERKQMEEALRESERRLADIINFMPDAAFVIDREGQVIAWNRAIEEMTGIKAQDMLGQGEYAYAVPFYGERRPILIDLVAFPEEELMQNYAQIKREGEVLTGETYVTHLKGESAYLQATASVLRDSRGRPVGAIEVIRDFSERKRMEEDLHRAKEAAEAATQAKSVFLATMSHEIRTPMNAVIGMTGLLLDTPLNPEQREFAETIRTSGDALLTIINDILDFSKIEAGRMELERQPLVVRECVESALELLAARAAEKGLNLACIVDPQVPPAVLGDATRLRQVLVNLIGNSIKFTESGEIVVGVRCAGAEQQGEHTVGEGEVMLHVSVRDTGLGIPPERMSRLFRSFSQVDASTTRKYGGTGLGLAISKRLSELMGGTMWVESEGVPGKGSTFHFTLRAQPTEMAAPRAYLTGVQPHLEGKRALIVDDNATNRRILRLQMQAWNMKPCESRSPNEALAWVQRGDPFDVAFLDLQMPEMDGLQLAAAIRRLRPASELPLVILSSLGQREDHAKGGELAAFLIKPIKASQLYDVLVGLFKPAESAVPGEAKGISTSDGERRLFDTGLGEQHPLRILLAEDNATNQKLAIRLLQRLGYRTDIAANGLEVLESLRRQPYDVVLMDVQMPEMDGLEATRVICRDWAADERPRIIAMTAAAMQEDRDECLAAGMDDFISKPIRIEELANGLRRSRPLATEQNRGDR